MEAGKGKMPGHPGNESLSGYAGALDAALSHIAVCQAPDTRLIGDGEGNTLFRRTASRPIRKLPLTPLQAYVWLHAATPIRTDEVIRTIRKRISGISYSDIAWVITDLRRDGYLTTLAAAKETKPS